MAVGQPTRPRYQRPFHPHQTHPGDSLLTEPSAAIPTANVPIVVPRQNSEGLPSSNLGSNGVGESSLSPSGPPSSVEPPPTPTSEPPSTSTNGPTSTEPTSTPTSTSSPSSITSSSTTSRQTSSTSSQLSSMSSEPSITPTPSETLLSSSSLTFSPETTITSPVVLTIDGRRTTSYVLIPTTLGDPGSGLSPSERTAVIAGSVAGGVAFAILVAAIILFYRRHQNKKKGFFPSSEPKPRTMLLAGEDLDDDYGYSRQSSNAPTPLPSTFPRTESPINNFPRSGSADQTPRLLRPRASDTGSIFHEGGIWPPPSDSSRLVDPILAGSHINLSNIVNDVMGGSVGQPNNASRSNTAIRPRGRRSTSGDTMTIYSEGSVYSMDLPPPLPIPGHGHSREASTTSETGLIPPDPLYLASTHTSGSSPSILPPRYEPPFDPSRSSTSISNPHGTKNWLDRSPRKMTDSPSNSFNRNPSPFVSDNGRYS